MSSDDLLHPSDLAHTALIFHMIQVSRDETTTDPKDYLLDIMYYLMDTIAIPQIKIFPHLSTMMQHVRTFIRVDQADVVIHKITEFIQTDFNTLDKFINFIENLKTVYKADSQATPTRLYVPNQITPNSMVGVFIRKVYATWESMMFEEHCEFFDSWKHFVDSEVSLSMDISPTFGTTTTVSTEDNFIAPTPSLLHHIKSVEYFLQHGNITETENTIHDYFDRISSNPLLIDFVAEEGKSVKKQLQELKEMEAGKGMAASWLRHQHAMMSLAIMWISANNYDMAQSAVEEALKTAQQRGDHPSVVKCLLLLFQVLQSSNNTSQESNNEELLIRCISKSGVLGLSDLVNEAVLIFAKTKIRCLVIPTSQMEDRLDSSNAAHSKDILNTNTTSLEWTFQQIMNLLAFLLHGETSLTVKYCISRSVANLDDTSGAAGPMGPGHHLKAANAAPSERINPLDSKYVDLYFQASLLYAECWERVGVSHMAKTYCTRALNLYSPYVKEELYIKVVCKLAFCQINDILHDYLEAVVNQRQDEQGLFGKFKLCYEVYENQMAASEVELKNRGAVVDITSNFLYIFLALSQQEWSRALRFATKIVNIIDQSIGGEISIHPEQLQDYKYDDCILSMEDKLRCKIVFLLLQGQQQGMEKDLLLEQIHLVVNRHQCVYMMKEASVEWILDLMTKTLVDSSIARV